MLTALLVSTVVASCTGAPSPASETGPFDSTTAVLAFHQGDRVRFANASGRVWGDIPATAPDWAWSADGRHLSWLDENRLHVVDSATGEDQSQPCPCSGLGRLGNRFATLSSSGAALLLFTPGAETERVPLSRTMPYASVVTGGEDRVMIAEPIPEELSDYRDQSALAEVDASGIVTSMIEGKAEVSARTGATSPAGTRIAIIDAPSGDGCYTKAGVLSLRYQEQNPAWERAIPSDEPYTTAVLDEVNLITGVHWAGDDLVVVFGPKPTCHILLNSRYVAYRLTNGEWEHLATGVSDLGFGAQGRSYTVEIPDHAETKDDNPYGTLVITTAAGARKEVGSDVEAFVLTPAEEAAGVVKARAIPKPEAVARTTDHGEPIPTAYQDLAQQIAAALDANDTAALESLCAKCDEQTRQQITTEEGRAALRRLLRTHPAVDDRSATFPGVAVKRCVDVPQSDEACTKEQIHDIGLLDVEAGVAIDIPPGPLYLAPATNSMRFTLDKSHAAQWMGRSKSAERYKNEPLYPYTLESYFFTTPDGEYHCAFTAVIAGCHGVTTPIPPRPASCGQSRSWGGGMFVDPAGKTGFLCSGGVISWPKDSLTDEPPQDDHLTPGQRVSAMGYTCTAGEHEMRCSHDATGHGFRMAPDSNEQF